MNKPVFIGVLLFLIIFVSLILYVKNRPVDHEETPESPASTSTTAAQPAQKINVKLFFYDTSSRSLTTESRSVVFRSDLHGQVREVITALIEGPQGELAGTIPKGTRLLDIFVKPDGVAYIDFSGELATNHGGGTDAEILTVYSIVDTLTLNFPQIKKVQILLDDRAVDTLTGHLDLSRPLLPDLSVAS